MDFIKGYKSSSYPEIQKELVKRFGESEKTLPDLAVSAEVQSTQTIKYALESGEQKVSDKVLTSVCQSLDLNIFVMWFQGEKHYFVKSKN